MEIRKADVSSIDDIMILIGDCINNMRIKGIYQWNEEYPNKDVFLNDISCNTLYILWDNDSLIGIVVLNEVPSPGYERINWKDIRGRALFVHRLAVHPSFQGKGYAKALMDFTEEYAKMNGYSSIRLDAYTGNHRAMKLYELRGYSDNGQVCFEGRDLPFNCYEKLV
mgnify:CR=1 FL=1